MSKRKVGEWVDTTYYGRGQVTEVLRHRHYPYRVRFKNGEVLSFHPNSLKTPDQRVDPGPVTL